MAWRRAGLLAVRLLALAAIVLLLVGQIEVEDVLTLADGTVLEGTVRAAEGGGWRVVPRQGGEARLVPAGEVLLRGGPERPLPAISWGLATLAHRLARHLDVVATVLVLFGALIALTAWRWWLLLATVDVRIGLARAVRLTFVGSFFNLAVPGATGGDVVKAWYAARSTGRGTRSVVAVFVDRVVGLVGLAVFAGLVLVLAPPREGLEAARAVVLGTLGATVAGTWILVDRRVRRFLGLGRLVRRLPFQRVQAEARAALRLYRSHPLRLGTALLVSLVNHGAAAVGVWLLGRALAIEGLDLATVLALTPIANLFAAIPLVPGGWGIGELAYAWLFGQVGVAATEAVGLSVVGRIAQVASSLPGGVLWLVWRDRPSRAAIARTVEVATEAVAADDRATRASGPAWGSPGGS